MCINPELGAQAVASSVAADKCASVEMMERGPALSVHRSEVPRAGPHLRVKRSLGCCFVCAGETGKE